MTNTQKRADKILNIKKRIAKFIWDKTLLKDILQTNISIDYNKIGVHGMSRKIKCFKNKKSNNKNDVLKEQSAKKEI